MILEGVASVALTVDAKGFFSYILDAKGLEKQAGAKKLRGEHVISYLSRRFLMNLVTRSLCNDDPVTKFVLKSRYQAETLRLITS